MNGVKAPKPRSHSADNEDANPRTRRDTRDRMRRPAEIARTIQHLGRKEVSIGIEMQIVGSYIAIKKIHLVRLAALPHLASAFSHD